MTEINKCFAKKFSQWIEEMKQKGESAEQDFALQLGELLYFEKSSRQLTIKGLASLLEIKGSTLSYLLTCDESISIKEAARILYKLGYEIKFSFIKIEENIEPEKYIPEPVETE